MWNVCGSAVTLFLLYKVAAGKDWARQILLNLMLLGLIVGLLFTLFSGLGTWLDGLVSISVRVLEIASIVLLYLPVSNRWFDAASG
jgi:hypothetical protein